MGAVSCVISKPVNGQLILVRGAGMKKLDYYLVECVCLKEIYNLLLLYIDV